MGKIEVPLPQLVVELKLNPQTFASKVMVCPGGFSVQDAFVWLIYTDYQYQMRPDPLQSTLRALYTF